MNRAHSEEYRKLGLNIAYYRKERGLSQIQLADLIDISRTHMSVSYTHLTLPTIPLV